MSLEKATEALSFIESDDRNTWVAMGMALKAEFGDSAFTSWDQWGKLSSSYNPKSSATVWKSFKYGGRTTIASLYHVAQQGGWKDTGEVHVQTAEDIRRAQQERKRREQKAELQEMFDRKRASDKAEAMLKAARTDEHAYLRSKQLPEVKGLVLPEGELFIPMRDCVTGALIGGQLIRWMGEEDGFKKKFIPGMRAKGSAFRIGNRGTATTILCEGYATGLSIHKAAHLLRLDISVLVCFSAGNVSTVAGIAKGRRGIYADHDKSLVGQEAAKRTGLPYVMSDTVGNDANDDAKDNGLMHVAKKILQLQRDML